MYTNATGIFNIYEFSGGFPIYPDGGGDSSEAINNAAMEAGLNGGGIVFIPPGMYLIGFTISLPPYVELAGSDQSDTTFMAAPTLAWSTSDPTLYTTVMVANSGNVAAALGQPQPLQYHVSVRDITFNGNGPNLNATGSSGAIIDISQVEDVLIQRCTIYNCQNHGISVQNGDESTSIKVGNVKILENTIDIMATEDQTTGVRVTGNLSIRVGACFNVIVRNNVIGYNPNPSSWADKPVMANDGIDVLHCEAINVSGNQIQYVTDGIGCDYGFSCILTDNIVENFQGFGVRSLKSTAAGTAITHLVIARNVVNAFVGVNYVTNKIILTKGCISSDAGLPFQQGQTGTPTSWHTTVANNTVKGPVSDAILACGAAYCSCTGNSVDLNTVSRNSYPQQLGIQVKGNSITVRGNQVYDSTDPFTGSGIRVVLDPFNVATELVDIVVDGNTVTGALAGIELRDNATDVTVTDNQVTDNTIPIQILSGIVLTGCRIAGNLGFTPPAVTPQPTITASAQENTFTYDCLVSIAGTALSAIYVNGSAIAWPSSGTTVTGPISVKLPVGGSISVVGSGATWYWTPQ